MHDSTVRGVYRAVSGVYCLGAFWALKDGCALGALGLVAVSAFLLWLARRF